MHYEKTNTTTLLGALAVGAGCMYLLDPMQGRRRRAHIRDKAVSISHSMETGSGVVIRDLANRTAGIAASLSRALNRERVDDPVLVPRIRSEMGRWVSHPRLIHVDARDGRVTLTGDILASEERDLIRHLEQVSGVKEIDNRLKTHETAENLASFQGGSRREPRFEFMQTNWAPGPRLLAGLSGLAIMAQGIRTGGFAGFAVSVAGALLTIRAATNVEFSRVISAIEEMKREEGSGAGPEKSARPPTAPPPQHTGQEAPESLA